MYIPKAKTLPAHELLMIFRNIWFPQPKSTLIADVPLIFLFHKTPRKQQSLILSKQVFQRWVHPVTEVGWH